MFGTLLGIQANSGHPSPTDRFWYEAVGSRAQTGHNVTGDNAMRVSAVYACVRVLAETLAQMPCLTYERLEDGKRPASDHNISDVVHRAPNGWQSAFEFFETGQGHAGLRGNSYSRIISGKRGAVEELVALRPDRMVVERLSNRKLRYVYTPESGPEEVYSQDEILHVRGFSADGVVGLSPIESAAKERIGIAMAQDEHAGAFFKNQAQPGGLLSFPNRLDPKARERNKKSWQNAHTGPRKFEVAVLEGGASWEAIGMSNKDAEFLELRKYSDVDIARLFRVPPHMIGILDRATYSNIEQQSLEFVMYTMMPWVKRWEGAINRDLIDDPQRYFVEFQVNGLLRGDAASRYEAYAVGIQNGWLSVNDVRRLENMNPVEGGDTYLSPLNMVPAGERGNETEQEDTEETDDTQAVATTPKPEAREWVKTWALDAAERIAKAEHRELSKRAKHAATDRPKFDDWAATYYDDHTRYAEKAIAPLCAACGVEGSGGIAAKIAAAGRMTIQAGDPVAVLEGWPSQREEQIANLILENTE